MPLTEEEKQRIIDRYEYDLEELLTTIYMDTEEVVQILEERLEEYIQELDIHEEPEPEPDPYAFDVV